MRKQSPVCLSQTHVQEGASEAWSSISVSLSPWSRCLHTTEVPLLMFPHYTAAASSRAHIPKGLQARQGRDPAIHY